jgi:hypothetical protein
MEIKKRSAQKVFFVNMEGTSPKDFYPTKILLENFNLEIVDRKDDADIIVGLAIRHGYNEYINDKKNIIISGENLFFRRNLMSILESILNKIFGNRKYKIIDFLDKIIPKCISGISFNYFMPGYARLLSDVKRGRRPNIFFVLSNEAQCKNTVSFPGFLQYYYTKMDSLLHKKKISLEGIGKRKFCAFIASSNSSRERVDFFKKLSKYKKVDSYGKVMNNMGEIAMGKDWKGNYNLFKKYKFVICFENSFSNDYIMEKLPNVMFANSIPIYRGAPNINEYFNSSSFVNYGDYGSYKLMIKKIKELDNDEKKYIEFISRPWFKNNKMPSTVRYKKYELINFYRGILCSKQK